MTTRKPNDQARANAPVADRPVPKPAPQPSQADQAHIATAGYWREQQAAIDRIAKLKAARLAQDGGNVKPAKPKAKPKKPSSNRLDRPKTSRSRRWQG
jgi:hypothetical protein